jgi:hypothetical protein
MGIDDLRHRHTAEEVNVSTQHAADYRSSLVFGVQFSQPSGLPDTSALLWPALKIASLRIDNQGTDDPVAALRDIGPELIEHVPSAPGSGEEVMMGVENFQIRLEYRFHVESPP